MNKFTDAPKNQWALAVRYLIEHHKSGLSMTAPVKDYFYKFQTRLLEVEKGRKDKIKVRRLPMTAKNRFGHTMTYTNYKSLASYAYLVNLYNKLNKLGNKALHH